MTKKKSENVIEYEVESNTVGEENVDGTTAQVETEEELVEEKQKTSSNKLPPNMVKLKGRWWVRYLITTLVIGVLATLIAWARGAFSETNQRELLRELCDAFSISGLLFVSFGLLIVVSNGGAFDMLSYGIRTLFRLFKKDPLDRKYGGYNEYRQARREKKRDFWYLVIVGAVFLLVGIALFVWYYVVYRK